MEINITFRHTESSPTLQDHIRDRIARLSRYFLKATHAHVILTVEKARHVAEVTLNEDHRLLTAREVSHDMYRSVDTALQRLERQLKKRKERVRSHHKF